MEVVDPYYGQQEEAFPLLALWVYRNLLAARQHLPVETLVDDVRITFGPG